MRAAPAVAPARPTGPGDAWFTPPSPVAPARVREARESAPVVGTVRGEHFHVLDTSTVTYEGTRLSGVRTLIAYDVREFEVDGVEVRDFTVKVFLTEEFTPEERAHIADSAARGADEVFNQGYGLPDGRQFHVTVEFTDERDAHVRVSPTHARTDQLRWRADSPPVVTAHETGHLLGLDDETRPDETDPDEDPRAFPRHRAPVAGLMDGGSQHLRPHHLTRIHERMRVMLRRGHQPVETGPMEREERFASPHAPRFPVSDALAPVVEEDPDVSWLAPPSQAGPTTSADHDEPGESWLALFDAADSDDGDGGTDQPARDGEPDTATTEPRVPVDGVAPEDPTTSVARFWQTLPDYFREGRALGTIRPIDARGRELVLPAVRALLPATGEPDPKHLGRLERALRTEFESLMGGGRTFQVPVGGSWFELRVAATPLRVDDEAALVEPVDRAVTDVRTGANVTSTAVVDGARANDLTVAAMVTQGIGPYGMAIARVPRSHPHTYATVTTSLTHQGILRSGDSTHLVLPVRYTVSLLDADGRVVRGEEVRSGPAGAVDVTFQVPDDLHDYFAPGWVPAPASPLDRAWGRRLDHPFAEAVVDLDEDKAFELVAGRMHPSITRLGADGRAKLRDFLRHTTITNNLVPMISGWVTSPDLTGSDGARAAAVRARVVLHDAALVGVNRKKDRLRDREQHVDANVANASITTGFTLRGSAGGGLGLPLLVFGGAGLTGGYSARLVDESYAGTTSTTRTGVEIKEGVALYRVAMDVEVRTPTGEDIVLPATAYLRTGVAEAAAQGLPLPLDTAAALVEPVDAGTRFEPPYLAAGLAPGNARISGFAVAAEVQPQVEAALNALPGFEDFLPAWNQRGVHPYKSGLSPVKAAEQLDRVRALTAKLSASALRTNLAELLGPGVAVQLHRHDRFRTHYVDIVVKAKHGPGDHQGGLGGRRVRHYAAGGPKLGSATTTTKAWTGGVEGRFGVVRRSLASVTTVLQAAIRFHRAKTKRSGAGPVVETSSLDIGSPTAQKFRHDVEFHVEITTFSRPARWLRGWTPGSHRLQVPEPGVLARTVDPKQRMDPARPGAPLILELIRGPVDVWLGHGSTTSEPAAAPPGHRVVELPST
ncbi:hypothetical protein AB0G02_21425, partial [Actinosynnema sp. NPDC023658]|uniref:hypothetical protein n=1 Tax=Actinosynnema sp. NPDC023658 TaxID=3155465 RepID=UPI0033D37D92